jgi:hypothetical protein
MQTKKRASRTIESELSSIKSINRRIYCRLSALPKPAFEARALAGKSFEPPAP